MLLLIQSLCVSLCVSSLFLVSAAQFFDTGASSLGGAPVGFISRIGVFGDHESIASLGNAPVGVYQRRQFPQPWYPAPRIPFVEVHQPPVIHSPIKIVCQKPGPCGNQVVKPVRPVHPPVVRPPVRPKVVRPPVRPPVVRPHVRPPVVRPHVKPPVRPPVVRPLVKIACQKPGSCRGQVVKPVRPVRPPPPRPNYKPVVRPPVKPGVHPPKRPVPPYNTRHPKTYVPGPKPGDIGGRSAGGFLGGLLGGLLG